MGLFDKLFGRAAKPHPYVQPDWIITRTRCAQCKKYMNVVLGMGAKGVIRVNDSYELMRRGVMKGSWRCVACGVYYCFDCSEADKTCSCGTTGRYQEVQYLEG